MDPRDNLLRIYKELADWYERQRQPQMRDRFLVLAADAALLAGKADEAEKVRLRLLKVNPHHMLKPYTSFAQALKAQDVLTYVKDLRVNYPADVAEDLLRTLQGDEKRPTAGVPATLPPGVAFDGSVTGPLPRGLAEGETYLKSNEEEVDLGQTAAPGAFNSPRRAPAPPQTIPLQGQHSARPAVAPARSATPPRAVPVASRRPLPAPLPPDARTGLPPPAAEPTTATGGSWLAVLLFLLVAVSGLALTGFTLLRPYLQLP